MGNSSTNTIVNPLSTVFPFPLSLPSPSRFPLLSQFRFSFSLPLLSPFSLSFPSPLPSPSLSSPLHDSALDISSTFFWQALRQEHIPRPVRLVRFRDEGPLIFGVLSELIPSRPTPGTCSTLYQARWLHAVLVNVAIRARHAENHDRWISSILTRRQLQQKQSIPLDVRSYLS
ncbi:hypothetical protein M433DRAFT_477457 [Acidomyces richmondensis BFW]|nr:hypothetical protein M433DRAFT_477457 [Acidomyces richmondensis BFW]